MSEKVTVKGKNHHALEKLPVDSESLANDFERYLTRHLGRFIGCVPSL